MDGHEAYARARHLLEVLAVLGIKPLECDFVQNTESDAGTAVSVEADRDSTEAENTKLKAEIAMLRAALANSSTDRVPT